MSNEMGIFHPSPNPTIFRHRVIYVSAHESATTEVLCPIRHMIGHFGDEVTTGVVTCHEVKHVL